MTDEQHEDDAKPCTFNVSITGLAVMANVQEGMLVLLPDARRTAETSGELRHCDTSVAVEHAGFLTFDLRHLQPDAPACEVVVKLGREQVTFDGMVPNKTVEWDPSVNLPDFSVFASAMKLDPDLKDPVPPDSLLSRIVLSGGKCKGSNDTVHRMVSRVITTPARPGHQQMSNHFTYAVKHTTTIEAGRIRMLLTPFTRGKPRSFTLRPIDGVIDLKISNLCADNPLEWPELSKVPAKPTDDLDFKWLSKLFVERDSGQVEPFDEYHHAPFLSVAPLSIEGQIANCFPATGSF